MPRCSHALQPVLGVALDDYVSVSKRLASHGYDPSAVLQIAAELGIPADVWRLARAAWDQRLATDPDVAGTGIGSELVMDALRWCLRRRVRRVLVNTQEGNDRALALYRRLGFEPTPTDLVVLTRPIP